MYRTTRRAQVVKWSLIFVMLTRSWNLLSKLRSLMHVRNRGTKIIEIYRTGLSAQRVAQAFESFYLRVSSEHSKKNA